LKKGLTERQKRVLEIIKDTIRKSGYPPTEREIAQKLGLKWIKGVQRHIDALKKKGYIKKGKGARAIQLVDFIGVKEIPILGEIAAGRPILAEENIQGYFKLNEDIAPWKDAFLLKVEGDSMREAGIFNRDYVLVKPQAVAKKKDIVVVLLGDEATVKYFYPEKDKIILKPANKEFKPIILHKNDNFRILGKVMMVLRFLR